MSKSGPGDGDKSGLEDVGRDYYVSADGQVSNTPQEAVGNSLQFENASNTGAGCNQDPANIQSSDD